MEGWVKILIVILTLFVAVRVLQQYGVFEKTKGVDELAKDIKKRKSTQNEIKFEKKLLGVFEGVCNAFGQLALSPQRRENYKFYIDRLELKSEVLDRPYTPEELRGKELCQLLIGLACIPLGLVKPIVLVATVVFVIKFCMENSLHEAKINDEDAIIEDHFIDLYLMLHPKLKRGSKARLASTVDTYINTLSITEDVEVARVMGKFATFFLNNLYLYEDQVAVPKLKERYRSAVIVNFCNVATQALQGIENSDILTSTRMELIRKKKNRYIRITEKRGEWANRVILVIYVNLFVFVVLSWVSKLPAGIF